MNDSGRDKVAFLQTQNQNMEDTQPPVIAPKNEEQPRVAPSASATRLSAAASGPNIVGVHYKIGRKIGEGSFGIIYEGKSLSCGCESAQ